MRLAFKEWAIIVDALGRGEQILILRKGGLQEGASGFRVEHPQFLLLPTRYHQQREAVVDSAQARFDEIALGFPPDGRIRVEFSADVVDCRRLDQLTDAARLRGQHIWRDDVIEQRFDWGREKEIHALAVRVWRLPQGVELPLLPSYAGCKSWVELERDIDTRGAAPVLDDASFGLKLNRLHAALAGAGAPA